ncbi:hypothetical protein [Ornithinimicrobium avium]|uniref:Uncharacterized protein n=1 Tax=Ornithinimicrobium avium TaxID=2283195 RepID=A0A345NJ53_9MICO|nr:hypothetical protein [Ornithinimicrobium avium]AXH95061.1 hypothetical protein DV701_01815 [Ornithinimicrobium avium]
MSDGPRDDTTNDHEEEPAGSAPSPATDPRPRTGDRAVDDALAAFDRTVAEGAKTHVAAAAEAHRALQSRLTSPPVEPPAPGQGRPGPPR